jgi:cobaltochelatase CobT
LKPAARGTGGDGFKRALIQSTRALAGTKQLAVSFGPLGPKLTAGHVLLPPPNEPPTAADVARIRGQADRMALQLVYHDEALHASFRPSGARARELYDALEETRFASIGARVLDGVAANLDAALIEALQRKGNPLGHASHSAGMTDALALLVRERLTGRPTPAPIADFTLRWRAELERRVPLQLSQLTDAVHDQQRFAFVVHDVLKRLDLGYELGAASERRRQAQSAAVPPPPADAAHQTDQGPALQLKTQQGTLEADAPLIADSAVVGARADGEDGIGTAPQNEDKGDRLSRALPFDDSDHPNRHYRVFTSLHDEVIRAEDLCEPRELNELRASLDQKSASMQAAVGRLANRLERLLRTHQQRRWTFDLEEGVLDASRLARVIVDPLAALSFKVEADVDFKDTVVTVLLDNSGSMRGRPIMVAALCADMLARTLERCAVKIEILGFTTQSWKGGRSREDWLHAGRPAGPGRLSDVRYIIYKSADAPWRRARRNLGLMLREDLLKENIDGEALLWAHERLLRRNEQRRILMVVSDGVPLDEATLSANPGGYLEQHLRNTIKWIEKHSSVELIAVGIGHDVTDFYARAVAIAELEQLGGAMTEQLAQLFAHAPAHKVRRPRA